MAVRRHSGTHRHSWAHEQSEVWRRLVLAGFGEFAKEKQWLRLEKVAKRMGNVCRYEKDHKAPQQQEIKLQQNANQHEKSKSTPSTSLKKQQG